MLGPEAIAFLVGAAVCMLLMGDFNWWDDDPPPRKRRRYRDEED